MNCPRCGAAGQDGREECSACGVIFARWRPREPRPVVVRPEPPQEVAKDWTMVWVSIPLALMFVLGMLLWASARRAASSEAVAAIQSRVAQTRIADGPTSRSRRGWDRPDDAEIIEIIEQCNYFQDRILVKLPTRVSPGLMRLHADAYPALLLAANLGVVEFHPPFNASDAARYLPNPVNPGETIEVRLGPSATAAFSVTSTDIEYTLDLGYRRVGKVMNVSPRPGEGVSAGYEWTVDAHGLVGLAPDSDERVGGAEIVKSDDTWRAVKVWRNTPSGALILCADRL